MLGDQGKGGPKEVEGETAALPALLAGRLWLDLEPRLTLVDTSSLYSPVKCDLFLYCHLLRLRAGVHHTPFDISVTKGGLFR